MRCARSPVGAVKRSGARATSPRRSPARRRRGGRRGAPSGAWRRLRAGFAAARRGARSRSPCGSGGWPRARSGRSRSSTRSHHRRFARTAFRRRRRSTRVGRCHPARHPRSCRTCRAGRARRSRSARRGSGLRRSEMASRTTTATAHSGQPLSRTLPPKPALLLGGAPHRQPPTSALSRRVPIGSAPSRSARR